MSVGQGCSSPGSSLTIMEKIQQNKAGVRRLWRPESDWEALNLNFAVDVLLYRVRTFKSEALAFCLEMWTAPQGLGWGCCPKKKSQSIDVV